MKVTFERRLKKLLSVVLCGVLCLTGFAFAFPETAYATETEAGTGAVHVYADTPGDEVSSKYTLTANGTDVPVIKYSANGNNFDIARFSSDDATPEYTVTVTEDINSVKVYPERYYPQENIKVSEDKRSVTFTMSDQLRYCFVMINGGPADQAGKPYLAIINDPMEKEEDIPDPEAENVLNFQTFMEEYLEEHPNSDAQKAEAAGTTTGGTAYEAGELVANATSQVRFPDKREMTVDDATYALQAALDAIYAEDSPYDTLYFPAGTYTWSGLEIRNRKGKAVTIYVEEGALLKNRIQECMQAMEPAIGIWDSEDITISGRGIFDGNGVANYKKDRHDAKDSCHQGGVMIVRSSNITFNDTYVRDAKQWNWESHGSKNCTLNNIKGLTPYDQPWVDGLDMASAQNLTINGALTLGNDDNFASGHYNPSDGFTDTVPGYNQYNSDCLKWDTEDSYNVNVSNTLGWSYSGGNGIRLGHNTYGHQMRDYHFTNVNTTNFQGGDRGITVQNGTNNNHAYPQYQNLTFTNCSFDTSRVSKNFDINGLDTELIPTVTLENCWFSNGDAESFVNNVEKLTITDLYVGGEKVEVSNFANLTTTNITTFNYDWTENQAPVFTAPEQTEYEGKVDQKITFNVTATDDDEEDTVTLSAEGLPTGAKFENGSFTWTPSDDQLGSYEVTFTATDSYEVKTIRKVTFTINDKVGNGAPIFVEPENTEYTVNVGNTVAFIVRAEDAEKDAVTLSVVGDLPRGAIFDADTGVFTWNTSANQTGSHEIIFDAVDSWGASARTGMTVNVETGLYRVVDIPVTEDTYMAAWKDEKDKNYEENEYLRVLRMTQSTTDSNTYGLWGEKIDDISDSKDAKISVLKFNANELKENLENLEKAELELTLINRRNSSSTGNDRLMAVAVAGEWNANTVTWNTHPQWDADAVKYSDEFRVDKNQEVKNNVSIASSSYDGTKVTIDVTDFVKNLTDEDTTLSIAVCDEKGYELAFASAEGAEKLDEEKGAVPVLRLSVKEEAQTETKVTVSEDSFVGSWSGDKDQNFGNENFLRVAYVSDSVGVLGAAGGNDSKVTYLKFGLSSFGISDFDSVELQMTVLGVRKDAAKNQETKLRVGVADNTDWTENSITWNNKPDITTKEEGLILSEVFRLGEVMNANPTNITGSPDGTVAIMDVTEFVRQAKESGKEWLTLVVNIDNGNEVMTKADANRIYFVSKEGVTHYTNAENMAPTLVLTKDNSGEIEKPEKTLQGIFIAEKPSKTEYQVGEELDLTGMQVMALYSDGTQEDVTSQASVEEYDVSEVGKVDVTVTYNNMITKFIVQVNAVEQNDAKVYGATLSLDGTIGVNFYVDMSAINEAERSGYSMHFTVNGETVDNAVFDDAAKRVFGENIYYRFTCPVAAKQMTDTIEAQLFEGDNAVSEEYTYSVKTYCDRMIQAEDTTNRAKLLKAMLNYGGYAQVYFGNYNGDNLANTGLYDETDPVEEVTKADLEKYHYTTQDTLPTGITQIGATLFLESSTTIRFYIHGSGEGYTFSVNGTPCELIKNDGNNADETADYYIEVPNISVRQLDTVYTLAISNSSGAQEYSADYSALTYAYNILADSNNNDLKNVVKALYLYFKAAQEYTGWLSN